MPKQPETLFKESVQRKLKTIPNLWFVKVQQVATRGIPDVLICYRGQFYAWELKTETGRASKLQMHNLQNIAIAGGVARIVTPSNFENTLKELLNGITSSNPKTS